MVELVHIVTARTTALGEPALEQCRSLLSAEERERHDRFFFERDRRTYAVAHALLRRALSRHAPGVSPREWRFRAGSHGKPEVESSTFGPAPRFNLSHCPGLAACAVTLSSDVGIDVEELTRVTDVELVARRTFATAEVEALERLDATARREAFFSLWTLKEAYVKARGLGLSLPLTDFAFTLEPLSVAFEPRLAEDAALWHFELRRPSPEHVLALAVRRAPGREVRVLYEDEGL